MTESSSSELGKFLLKVLCSGAGGWEARGLFDCEIILHDSCRVGEFGRYVQQSLTLCTVEGMTPLPYSVYYYIIILLLYYIILVYSARMRHDRFLKCEPLCQLNVAQDTMAMPGAKQCTHLPPV